MNESSVSKTRTVYAGNWKSGMPAPLRANGCPGERRRQPWAEHQDVGEKGKVQNFFLYVTLEVPASEK